MKKNVNVKNVIDQVEEKVSTFKLQVAERKFIGLKNNATSATLCRLGSLSFGPLSIFIRTRSYLYFIKGIEI